MMMMMMMMKKLHGGEEGDWNRGGNPGTLS